jgi:phosphatidylinositol alpha-1,6-mannosyltransferase
VTRTLVITNDFPPRRGGIESFVFSLCEARPPGKVVVYTARMDGAAAVDAAVRYPVIRDRSRMLLPTPRVGRTVRAVAVEHGCDEVMFGAAAPLGLLARGLRRAGVRRIVGLTHGHEVWWAKVPGTRQLLRRIGDDVDVVTYVSEYCRAEISRALSPGAAGRMQRLSPTVDTERFRPGLDGSIMRARWGIDPGRPVVLSASRLVRRKSQDTLIRAWPRVLAEHPDALLLIVGSGPSRRRLGRMVRRRRLHDSVRFVPSVPWEEMPLVYATADVFALPCRTRRLGLEAEAFGIVFLEAAAAGLPVIGGTSGGVPEVLRELDGVQVDPGSPDGLVAALVATLQGAERRRSRHEVPGPSGRAC